MRILGLDLRVRRKSRLGRGKGVMWRKVVGGVVVGIQLVVGI